MNKIKDFKRRKMILELLHLQLQKTCSLLNEKLDRDLKESKVIKELVF